MKNENMKHNGLKSRIWMVAVLCWVFQMSASAVAPSSEEIVPYANLAGTWEFQIDRNDVGKTEQWYRLEKFSDTIELPGSMLQRLKGDDISVNTKWVGSLYDSSYFFNPYLKKYRNPGKDMKLTFFLTPDKHYVGVAWYKREVEVSKSDLKNNTFFVYLERPHIESTLYVNGREVGMQNSLTTSHQFDVTGFLKSGRNTIVIRIDNRVETVQVGQDSHSVTDQTQGDWNGIVGKMELRKVPRSHIIDLQVFPDVDRHLALIRMQVTGKAKQSADINIRASLEGGNYMRTLSKQVTLTSDTTMLELYLDMGTDCPLWNEFSPNVFSLSATYSSGKNSEDIRATTFGMRKFEIRGRMFYVNGTQIQLRGTVENCCFPLTGYAPMDVESWTKVFQRCREYGLNHMRFHSYCPPEAAFIAADRLGFYLQPEGPSWPNHGVKLGYGNFIDKYLMDETKRMTQEYGNHPSFCMLACGNEPAGRWVEWCSKFVDYWKQADSRRVYTGASVGGGWAWQPKSQYHVKAGARGLNWNRRPQSTDDYTPNITRYNGKDTPGGVDILEPFVSHETGQWCVFPNLAETEKYTGSYKARNFEVFKDILYDNGMGGMEKTFLMSSGKLQALCYKYEIERTLRTPDYAGFQLLALNDYSGQGSAIVGVTDVFFDDKGYITADEFRQFCSPVVPLAKIEKFTYLNSEQFKAALLLNQFQGRILHDVTVKTTIKGTHDVFSTSEQRIGDIPVGQNFRLDSVKFSLGIIKIPTKMTLEVDVVEGLKTVGRNHWDFWVYPKSVQDDAGDVFITDKFDDKARETLANGGKVLLTAAGKITYGKDIVQQFTPVFWNTSWFKMRPPHTTGICLDLAHPVFSQFPTDYHSDLQWWELVEKAQVMQFTEFPKDFQPIVQSIDTWFLSRKIGMLFEANIGNGKLMMTTMDITNNLDTRIVARQMRASILSYMNSGKFNPKYTLDSQLITDLFTKQAPRVDMFTNESPDELKPKIK